MNIFGNFRKGNNYMSPILTIMLLTSVLAVLLPKEQSATCLNAFFVEATIAVTVYLYLLIYDKSGLLDRKPK